MCMSMYTHIHPSYIHSWPRYFNQLTYIYLSTSHIFSALAPHQNKAPPRTPGSAPAKAENLGSLAKNTLRLLPLKRMGMENLSATVYIYIITYIYIMIYIYICINICIKHIYICIYIYTLYTYIYVYNHMYIYNHIYI